jgi:dipeptidyl aminopeptidase/acylaminoacyl peptidase
MQPKHLPFLLLTLLLLSTAGGPASAKPTLEDYGALPEVGMMSVSPDGTLVAFRHHAPGRDLVLVYSLADGKIAGSINVTDIRPDELYFLDESRLILVASDEERLWGYSGVHRISTAFALDLASGEVVQLLVPGDNIVNGQSGLGEIVGVSSDGRRVYMPAFADRQGGGGDPNLSLMEVDLESVRRPRIAKRGHSSTIDYFVDDSGNVLAEEIFNNRSDLHSIIAYRDGKNVEIYRHETDIPEIGVVALTSDRKALIFADDSETSDRVSYYTMSLADGTVSAPIFDRDDADVEAILRDVNRIAWGVVYSGLTPSYEFFDESLTRRMAAVTEHFAGNSVWLDDASPDRRHLVLRVEGSDTSGKYYLLSGDKILLLADIRPQIAAEDVNPVIAYEYLARDGAKIPSLMTVPREHAASPQNLPAVMLPHGGPETHDWLGFDWLAQALASEGYVVIQPQFRGSSGFGVRHKLAGRGEWGRKSQADITDALKDLAADGIVDPERVCIVGGSYGGFAALAGGAFTPELYRCVVSINGVSDVRRMLADEKSDHGRDHWALAYWNEVIARGDTSKETLDSISPATAADQFLAPVLLVHGDKDKVVDFGQSRHMERQLERAGKAVQLVKLEGEDHYLSSPATRLQCLEETVAFVNRHIRRD